MYRAKGVEGRLLLMLLTGFAMQAVVAGDRADYKWWEEVPPPVVQLYSFVASISAGPAWESSGNTRNTFYLQPGIQKTFDSNKQATTLADSELFFGLQRILTPRLDGQLGVAIAFTSNAKFSGNVWDDADPDFSNFTYDYNVNHTHVVLKGKLLTDVNTNTWLGCVKPWISGGVGAGFNIGSFPAAGTSGGAASAGSVSSSSDKKPPVGVGYEFADWGKSQLARAPGQTLGRGLWLNHIYTTGLMFNLTFVS